MGNFQKVEHFTKNKILKPNEIKLLKSTCRIIAITSHIPKFISIFVYIFQDSKLQLGQKVEFALCILLNIYGSSHYLPVSPEHQWICYFQCIISFGIQVVISYLAMIYSYIALIKFTKPNIINSKFNIFFIYFSPIILYLIIIVYILFIPELVIFFEFTVYPLDYFSRLLNYSLVFIFLLITIFNNALLIIEIKKFKKQLSNMDSYMEEKLRIFIKKLIFNIIGIIFVFHYNLPVGFLTSFEIVSFKDLYSFGYFFYLYINKALQGIVFWFIYIYNINFWHKFLILIRLEKKENYQKIFENEDKAMEYNIDEGRKSVTLNMTELNYVPTECEDENL
jgi:hypothetical protein